jgi:hypothetical protein
LKTAKAKHNSKLIVLAHKHVVKAKKQVVLAKKALHVAKAQKKIVRVMAKKVKAHAKHPDAKTTKMIKKIVTPLQLFRDLFQVTQGTSRIRVPGRETEVRMDCSVTHLIRSPFRLKSGTTSICKDIAGRTLSPRSFRAAKACGLVTSWIRCRPMKSCVAPLGSSAT